MNLAATESAAAELLRAVGRRLRRRQANPYRAKGVADLVSDLDLVSEEALRRGLPRAAFWGEEGGRQGDSEWCWVVDPIDGTTNFVHGYPQAAISAALARRGEVRLGLVYDLYRRELYTARAGEGARRNGKPIEVSPVTALEEALLATGFGPELSEAECSRFRRLQARSHGVRRSGCCSLDLCWVACGRLDAFYEWDLQAWDVAAGGLIVREAGGRFTALDGSSARLERGDFLASNGHLHDQLTI